MLWLVGECGVFNGTCLQLSHDCMFCPHTAGEAVKIYNPQLETLATLLLIVMETLHSVTEG